MNAPNANDSARPFRLVASASPAQRSATFDRDDVAIAERVRFALGELRRVAVDPVAGRAAEALLEDLERLVEEHAGAYEGTKRDLWAAVANGRAALRAQRERGAPVVISPRVRDRMQALRDAVRAAEAKAQRKMAAPSAYRKLIEARRALTAALEEHGFATGEDFDAAIDKAPRETSDELIGRIKRELAAAEAAWAEFESSDAGALPGGTQADALRARGYQLLGRVVTDDVLRRQLDELATRGRRRASAQLVLEDALRDAGFEPGEDALALGESYLRTHMT